ncbi:carbohydrate kinase family protein [candidate division KSB1 bacterium]|nr:carbohydrate kinase family protein [candidate division KSB1 bacterium]
MPKTLAVLGTFIRDTIVTLDKQHIESIGGLYHSMAYLACLAAPGTVLRPLCYVGDDFFPTVKQALTAMSPHIQFDLMRCVSQPNTAVTLIYRSAESREEVTTPPMAAITKRDIEAVAQHDAVLVNLITGEDLTLPALQHLKSRPQPPLVYLDFHSLALGIDEQGRRYYREVPEWREWVSAADILQVNEMEAATLAGARDALAEEELIKFGNRLVAEYLPACNITLAGRGALIFYRSAEGISHAHIPAQKRLKPIDVIGCGDAFGAAFLTQFIEHNDYLAAARFANTVAGRNSTFIGSLTAEKFRTHVLPYLKPPLS